MRGVGVRIGGFRFSFLCGLGEGGVGFSRGEALRALRGGREFEGYLFPADVYVVAGRVCEADVDE